MINCRSRIFERLIVSIHSILLFILTCTGLHVAYSQPFEEELRFQNFSVIDGLCNNTITTIYQDSEGFLWIGTQNGLSRFDGYDFVNYQFNPKDPSSIYIEIVNDVVEIDNNIWIGSNKGVCIFNKATQKYSYLNNIPSEDTGFVTIGQANAIKYDNKGSIWIATFQNGLYRYNLKTGKFRNYSVENTNGGLNNNRVSRLRFDSDSVLWILTYRGLSKYDYNTDKITGYSSIMFNENSELYSMLDDNRGNILIATNNKLIKFNKKNQTYEPYPDPDNIIGNSIFYIERIDDNTIWVATEQLGLIIIDEKTNTMKRIMASPGSSAGLVTNQIRYIYRDKFMGIWIGAYMGGLQYYNKYKNKFPLLTSKVGNSNSLTANNISAVFEDSQGYIWIGTDGMGLNMYSPKNKSFTHFINDPKNEQSISSDAVLTIAEDENGIIWLGTWAGGLCSYDKRTKYFTSYLNDPNNPNSLSNNNVEKIVIDQDGKIYMGTMGGGMSIYDPKTKKFTRYTNSTTAKHGLADNYIFTLLNDSKDRLWVGSAGSGLYLFDKKALSFLNYQNLPGVDSTISNNCIYSLHEDNLGRIWIGTSIGLTLLYPDSMNFFRFYIEEGLPSNTINEIAEDEHGNIWLATNNGVCQIKLNEKINKPSLKVDKYSTSDGLQGNEFSHYCSFVSKDGYIFFGGVNGLNYFCPDSIKKNPIAPFIKITQLKIFNIIVNPGQKINGRIVLENTISQTKRIVLTHKENMISIEFAAIHFVDPANNKYSYMLQGFDKNWMSTDAMHRIITYTNLKQGKYTFFVKGSNSDGLENESGVSLEIIVLPPWWQTWWFRILMVVFIAGSSIGYSLYRINLLKKQQIILEKKVMERTAELAEANTQLEEQHERILNQKEEIASQRDKVTQAYENIQIISEFGQKITSVLNLVEIDNMVNEYINSLMSISAFGIGIYNEQKQIIEFFRFMEHGTQIPYFYKDVKSRESLNARCFRNKEEIIVNEVSKEYKKHLLTLPEFHSKKAPGSVVHLPLITSKKAIGTMTISSMQENAFSLNDLNNLRSLASYASIALDNANVYMVVNQQNQNIRSSINYAQTIQQSILPSKVVLDKLFENFILFKPRDVVSGDFYWFSQLSKNSYLIAVVDCTGHGVPGAFMSLISHQLLNEIVTEKDINDPKEILKELDKSIVEALRQDQTENKDGMDVCLCKIEKTSDSGTYNITFAGAARPLYYTNEITKKISILKGARRSIGGPKSKRREIINFSNETLELKSGNMVYMFSDGYSDQNNIDREKFGIVRLNNLLQSIHQLNIKDQGNILEQEFQNYKGTEEQRDDITILGIKLP